MLDGYGHSAVSFKGQPPCEHLVEDDTGGVNVAAGVDPISPCLFRRDIVNGAQCLLGQCLGGVFQAGDAEVGHLHTAVPQHHHILRLDVPVDDAATVGMAQVMKCSDSRQFSWPRFSIYCLSVMPSMSSMTIYSVSPPRETSYTETMLG